MIRDPFVAAAFRRAEDDGLTSALVDVDYPKMLDDGTAEALPSVDYHVLALVEAYRQGILEACRSTRPTTTSTKVLTRV